MREIEFRQPMFGENGEFIGFHYWGFIDGKFIGPSSAWNTAQDSQQWTGILDKNGVEIYKGDIFGNILALRCVVEWQDCRFIFRFIRGDMGIKHLLFNDWARKSEIIGNIYSNPELLTPEPRI